MSRLQYTDNRVRKETFTVELSKGQLIVIICLFLFMSIAFFGVGILVGKKDPSLGTETAAAPESEGEAAAIQEMETYTTPAFGNSKEEPAAAATATAAATAEDAPKAERTPETPPPRNPYMDNSPRLTALPPLTPYRSFPVKAEAPTRIPTPNAPAAPATPAPATVTAAAPAPAVPPEPAATTAAPAATAAAAPAGPQLTPIDPLEPPIMDAPVAAPAVPAPAAPPATAPVASAPAAAPVAAPAAAPVAAPAAPAKPTEPAPAVSGAGKFGVQLAAFSGGDRRVRAESFLKKVRDEFKLDAAIIPSSDDVHYRVISGSFPTKEAASTVCEELKRKTGLNEAFVRPL